MLEAFFLEWQMWTTLAIIAVAIVLYSLDRLSMELVSAAVLVALAGALSNCAGAGGGYREKCP